MIDHFSWATGDCTRGLAGLTSSSEGLGSVSESPRARPALSHDLDPTPRARGVYQHPGQLGSGSESPQGRPALSHDSGTGPRACGVNQLSQVNPAQVLGFAVDQLYLAPRARARCTTGSTSCSGGLGPGSECPRCGPSVPRLGPSSQVPWVNQVCRATRIQVRGPAGSTSCPVRLGPGSEGPGGRRAFPGHSGLCPRARGFDQLSRVNFAQL